MPKLSAAVWGELGPGCWFRLTLRGECRLVLLSAVKETVLLEDTVAPRLSHEASELWWRTMGNCWNADCVLQVELVILFLWYYSSLPLHYHTNDWLIQPTSSISINIKNFLKDYLENKLRIKQTEFRTQWEHKQELCMTAGTPGCGRRKTQVSISDPLLDKTLLDIANFTWTA